MASAERDASDTRLQSATERDCRSVQPEPKPVVSPRHATAWNREQEARKRMQARTHAVKIVSGNDRLVQEVGRGFFVWREGLLYRR